MTLSEAAMKRREFLKQGVQKIVGIASELAGEEAAMGAENWLRPPFAVKELDFLLNCTRCDKCIKACPYEVLFKLPAHHGLQVVGTPAMDLLVRGCHMCRGWPCVTACEPGVLRLPDQDRAPSPEATKLARVTINTKICLPYLGPECGACAYACPVLGALEWEDGLRPVIKQDVCTGCALCREACIVNPKAVDVSAFIPDDEEKAEG
jgi:ferredoxin|tara:strand:+ start:1324 stop:1944 length:621 start_codon:yes stop_codon:yes gene_type:complete